MQASLVIAQILGPMYVIVAVGLVANAAAYRQIFEAFYDSPSMAYLGGLIALIFGLVILAFHHAWPMDWTMIVTLIGWLALIKGSLLVVWPSAVRRLSRPLMAHLVRRRIWAVFPLALGLFLSVKGYELV